MLMVGATSDEWRLFLVPSGAIEHITAEMITGVARAYNLPVEAARAAYQSASPSARSGDLFAALLGDRYFRIPALRLADAHAKSHSATYMYEFAWPSSQFEGRLGACHALEVGFVFDTLGASTGINRRRRPSSATGDRDAQRLGSLRELR
jgi:para-nitrobenzyl esterase